jgi:hypothetical protein
MHLQMTESNLAHYAVNMMASGVQIRPPYTIILIPRDYQNASVAIYPFLSRPKFK